MATCPSGQGAVCKTVYTGSIPVVASTILSTNGDRKHRSSQFPVATLAAIGVKAGAKAGAEAGVMAGARYVMDNSRVRRKVERDGQGQIVATIEERVPASPEPTGKQPVGFRKRAAQ
jgi:hypothetical protein